MFVGETDTGVKVTMEPGPKYGGSGRNPTPMDLVAMALGGCTGIDILLVMQKMRAKLTRLEIDVETRRREEPPSYFEEIRLTYIASGDGVTEENLKRAASLSHDKYCSVGAMLKEKAKITYDTKVV
jgi:putative redox protein